MMTEAQYVKTVEATAFKTQGRGGRGVAGARLKADDLVRHVLFTTAHAYLLFFSNRGRVYRLRALDLPERERTAKGMPIVNLLPLQPGETIEAIIDTRDFAGERNLFFATRQGVVKKTSFHEYDNGRARRADRPQPARRRRAGPGHRDQRHRRHLHGQPQGHDDPLQRGRGAGDGSRRGRRARHEAEARRRGGQLRRRPRRHGDPDGHRGRLRQAHPARPVQRAGPRRPGRHRHPAHRAQGPGGRRVHGRPRRRHRRRVQRWRDDPHERPRDLARRAATPPACG